MKEESKGGGNRGDTPGIRIWHRDRTRSGAEVGSASAAGASSLAHAQPPARKQPERCRPVLGRLMPFIEAILTSDRVAPRKQRHTAHRIWQRIRAERPEQVVAESTIRKYVDRLV